MATTPSAMGQLTRQSHSLSLAQRALVQRPSGWQSLRRMIRRNAHQAVSVIRERERSKSVAKACSCPLHYFVATTELRTTARPARRMGDMCRQVSWLTAQALSSSLPDAPGTSGIRGESSPLTVAGAAADLGHKPRTAFPFHLEMQIPPPETVTRTIARRSKLESQYGALLWCNSLPVCITPAQVDEPLRLTSTSASRSATARRHPCGCADWATRDCCPYGSPPD